MASLATSLLLLATGSAFLSPISLSFSQKHSLVPAAANHEGLKGYRWNKATATAISSSLTSSSGEPGESSERGKAWAGEVVSNPNVDGQIKGCSIERVGDTLSEFIVSIDGVEADLGKFSEAIYRKITSDAKQQRFQGFRPGTIPPHLQPTYSAFSMDECAREATLEAMQQNNIRPFENAREDFVIENVSIPSPPKKGKKKKGGKKKKKTDTSVGETDQVVAEEPWLFFDSMKEAIDAGWKPGQSFSFVAKNVKGQELRDPKSVEGATGLGARGSAIDLNQIAANVAIDAAADKSND